MNRRLRVEQSKVERSKSGIRRFDLRLSTCALAAALLVAHSTSAQFCAGDCNLDDSVTIDELVVGVNIALGVRGRHDCPPADTNNDNAVTIDELIQAVRNALDGCLP